MSEILAGDTRGDSAAKSYPHPNGFDKLHLLDVDNGAKLLIHIWPRQGERISEAEEHIHDHRWGFGTSLLHGRYFVENFREDPDGAPFHRYAYRSPGEGAAFHLEPSGSGKLVTEFASVVQAPMAFFCDARVLHRVTRVDSEPIVTLFLQGPVERSATTIYAGIPVSAPGAVRVERMLPDAWQRRILEVIDLIGR